MAPARVQRSHVSVRVAFSFLAIALLAALALADVATAKTLRFPVAVSETSHNPFAAEPARCITVAYVNFGPVPGARSYSLTYRDAQRGGAPGSAARYTGASEFLDPLHGRGDVFFPLGWASPGGGACAGGMAARFTDAVVLVTVPDGASYVRGKVTDLDGEPVPRVPIAVRGAGTGATATTDATGSYVRRVRPGAYVVRPAQRRSFTPRRRSVRVRAGGHARADFRLRERESAEFVVFTRTDRRFVLSGDSYTVVAEITNAGRKGGRLEGVTYAARGSARVGGAVAGFVPGPVRLEPGARHTITFTATATPTTVRATVAGTDLDLQATHNPLSGVLVRAVGTSDADAGPRRVVSDAAATWVDVGQRGALRAAVAGSGTTLRQWMRTSSDLWALVRTENGRQVISQSAEAALLRASQTVEALTPVELAELYVPVVGPRRARGSLAAARKLKRDFAQLSALLVAGNHEALSERAGKLLPGAALEALVFGPAGKAAAPSIKRGFSALTGPATKGVRRKVNAARKRYGLPRVGAEDWRDATSGSRTTRGFENGAGWKQSDLNALERRARETGQTFVLFPRVATTRAIWNKGPEIKTKAVDWKGSWDHLLGYARKTQGLVVWRRPSKPPAGLRLVTTTKEWRDLNARYRARLADYVANRSKVAEWRRNGEIPVAELDWASNGVDPGRLTPELLEASRGRTLPFRIDRDGVMHIDGRPVGSDPDIAHVGALGRDLPPDELVSTYAYLRQSLDVRHFDSGRWADLRGRAGLLARVTQQQRGAAIAVTPDGRFVTRVAGHSTTDASWVGWEGLAGARP